MMKRLFAIKVAALSASLSIFLFCIAPGFSSSAVMQDYCVAPPFVSQSIPPLVLLAMGKDHKSYYEAYNDAYDLDEDGKIDVGYKHSIDYYGYFDPQRCYTYSSGGTARFVPLAAVATNKFCSSGQWSGNVLNYLTTSKMDAIRKIFYGGKRVSVSSNVLERSYIPQDAHSWGKEFTGRLCYNAAAATTPINMQYTNQCTTDLDCDTTNGYSCVNRSTELIGVAAADAPITCTPEAVPMVCSQNNSLACNFDADCGLGNQCVYTRTNQMLMLTYDQVVAKTAAANANNAANLLASYEPDRLRTPIAYVSSFNPALSPGLDPATNHIPTGFNYYVETMFEVPVGSTGNWTFAVSSNEAAEVVVDGTIVVGRYGQQSACAVGSCPTGVINLTAGWHRLIVRHFEEPDSGSNTRKRDGVTVWYDLPGGATTWNFFGSATLNLRAPDVDPSNTGNFCGIKTANFIATGIPETMPFVTGVARRHLFCNTSLGDGPSFPPLLRMMTNRSERIWQWASKERPVCNSLGTSGYPFGATAPTDFEVRAEVCSATETATKTTYFTNYCKDYPAGSNSGWMPSGLLQKFSEGDGTSVCSKGFTKSCNNNADCLAGEGECVAKTKMFFGLMTGTYEKNLQGGILQKNLGSFLDEINSNSGSFQASENARGNIAKVIDNMKIVGFRYSDFTYQDAAGGTCGWIANGPISNSQCRNWGNPIGEIMYEATRYFSNKPFATADYLLAGSDDAGIDITMQGCTSASGCSRPWIVPYSLYPSCARPFTLVFSDVHPSFDSDQIPGSFFGPAFSTDLTGLDVKALAKDIGDTEGITGTTRFIGNSANSTDFLCTSKNIGDLGHVAGICPEEPTKKGTYYSAAMAYYGKEKLKYCSNQIETTCLTDANCPSGGVCTKQNLTTYSVALSSQVPDITLKLDGKKVTFIPTGKTVAGACINMPATGCNCTFTTDADGLHMTDCNSYCPTSAIVDFYVDQLQYDASGDLTYAKFRVNFEDVEQGADHDMDVIVTYELSPDPTDPTKLRVAMTSDYTATCAAMALGFVIQGTNEDGAYLTVRNSTVHTKTSGLNLNWGKTFTVTGGSSQKLRDPLWYAAKWGGFEDADNSHTPNLASEWDKDGDGDPDNYFLVVNPLKMEKQIEEAFLSILRRASSGTAASVLASGEGSGANLVQAIFYPKRLFNKEISWTGTLQNLWYYLDPRLGNSTIREDTDTDNELELDKDYIVNMFFDTLDQRTKARRWASDAAGVPGTQKPTVYLEDLNYLWESGSQLHGRLTARDIRTNHPDGTLSAFTTGLASDATFRPLIQAADETTATNIINYVRGDSDGTGNRSRTVTDSATGTTDKIWKLGDIVNSTPKIVSWIPVNKYDMTYDDKTYEAFLKTATYQNRGTVFTGANDGMLHAFKLGTLAIIKDGTSKKATLTGTDLGSEQWAFIPRNALPYLKYLMDPDYCHLYYIDLTPSIFDASIEAPGVNTADYWTQTKTASSWRTVLIGGMKLGGACKNLGTANPFGFATDVETPVANVGFSSYFALDITNPAAPQLMWEFTNPNLGYSTTGPAIMRINAREVPGGYTTSLPNKKLNGKWFVVLASGPTGPINSSERQFKGYSDQPLRLFILDAKTGALLRTINTGDAGVSAADQINYAFGGSLNNSNIDYDFDYQDDALYLGYTKSEHTPPTAATRWTNGGVIRLVTREDMNGTNLATTGNTALNPNNWAWSHVIKDTGSISSAVAHLAHYRSGATKPDLAWLYVGTGRYFYKGDDDSSVRHIAGIKELCLRDTSVAILPAGLTEDPGSLFYAECTDGSTTPPASARVAPGDLVNKTCSGLTGAALTSCFAAPCDGLVGFNLIQCLSDRSYKGWHIALDSPPSERMITDPLAAPTGAVFFTTFAPSADACKFGGSSYLWAVNYETGGAAGAALKGKALLQVSTGAIEEIDLKQRITVDGEEGGRRTTAMDGVPPTGQGLAIVVPPKPIGKIMHIRKE